MYENILFEKKDGVAYLTLNRPDQLNALNSAVLKELDDALAAIDGDAEIRVLAVQQTKRCIRHGLESGLESGLSYEAQAFGLCFSTKDQKDRMRAFVNRRR